LPKIAKYGTNLHPGEIMYPIIGLCGSAGAGKDTAADYLVKQYSCTKMAFADPLKSIAQDFFPNINVYGESEKRDQKVRVPVFDRYDYKNHYLHDKALANKIRTVVGNKIDYRAIDEWCNDMALLYKSAGGIMSVRFFLQKLGTNLARQWDPNIWVNTAIETANKLLSESASVVIISDVRFRNEALAIKKAGGTLWKIENPDITSTDSHVSETEVKTIPTEWFDSVIYNGKAVNASYLPTRLTLLHNKLDSCISLLRPASLY